MWNQEQPWNYEEENRYLVEQAKLLGIEIAEGNKEYEKGVAKPTPTATPSSPSASPTASPGQTTDVSTDQQFADFQAQYGANRRGDTYAITANSPVYVPGMNTDPKTISSATTGDITNVGKAINSIYGWTEAQALSFSEMAMRAGYIDSTTIDINRLLPVWSKVVETSAGMYSVGKSVDPYTLIRRWADGDNPQGIKTSTSTRTQYTVTSALTAEQLAHAALSERLGRSASDKEVREFTKALNAAQAKNPDKVTETTTTDAEGNIRNSTSTTSQGLDAQQYAIDWAWGHNKDEARAYQAVGQLMPAFFEALGGPV